MKRRGISICIAVLTFLLLVLSGCNLGFGGSKDDTAQGTLPVDVTNAPGTSGTQAPGTTVADTSGKTDTSSPETQPPLDSDTDDSDAIDDMISQMTIKEKVAQLFIIRPDSLDKTKSDKQINSASAKGVTELTDEMANMLNDYPVGGIVMFSKNIKGETQIVNFINSLQSESKIPLFISVDEEGGIVARLANSSAFDLPQYDSAADVAKNCDPSDAFDMGKTIGEYLYKYAFNMDFAPVADVNTNPNNPVIGDRAFSSDPNIASEMANAMAGGLRSQGVIPVFKHFPGHGDTAEDSHSGIAISYKKQEEMEACEWLPYNELTELDCVMVGHIAVPSITGDLTPSTMSYDVVSGILRQKIGFNGVVITDSLSMGAIIDEYDTGEASIKAIEAGCDILLMPENFKEAFDAVFAAVESGRLSEERINESVYRILNLKSAYGLFD